MYHLKTRPNISTPRKQPFTRKVICYTACFARVMIFVNAGVKLTVAGSPVLEDLQALAAGGTEILVCGTCLGYFELKDQVAVGEVSNMYTIAETLLGAGKVVSP